MGALIRLSDLAHSSGASFDLFQTHSGFTKPTETSEAIYIGSTQWALLEQMGAIGDWQVFQQTTDLNDEVLVFFLKIAGVVALSRAESL